MALPVFHLVEQLCASLADSHLRSHESSLDGQERQSLLLCLKDIAFTLLLGLDTVSASAFSLRSHPTK